MVGLRMIRSLTRTSVTVVAVVLTVVLVAAAPVTAVGGEGASETTLGDHLGGGDKSSDGTDESEAESSDGGETNESTDDSSGDDSADESDGDGESTDGEPSSPDSDSDDSSDATNSDVDDSSDSDNWDVGNVVSVETVNDSSVSDVSLDDENDSELAAGSTFPIDDAAEARASDEENLLLKFKRAGLIVHSDVTDGTTLSKSLDAKSVSLVAETDGLLDVHRVESSDTSDQRTAPPRVERGYTEPDRSTSEPSSNAVGVGPNADRDETPLPPGPSSGLALGVGAVTVAAVGRNGTLLSNLATALAPTLTAGLAPVSRSGTFDRLLRMLAPLRYSRYDDSDPLEHDARASVYEVVDDAPGAYLSEVAEQADLPLSTVRHHIRVLEREDLVSGAKVRGKRRFYPAYETDIELAAALNDKPTAVVIDAVARLGTASVSDLADDLGRDPSTISHHLKRLEEDDIIVRERDGRAVMNKLSAEARTALDPSRDPETDGPEMGEALASD